MAKNIWYKIPFQSQLGIDYELRIYKEGTPTSVTTLRAGATPFVTDEDTNNDFFAPVRTQTGSITVIYEPGTQFPTVDVFMAALRPASNIDIPVKLYKIVNSTETLVWQGFLSSELYTQQYISFAQEVTLPVISVLQAMESVQITTAAVSGLMTVLNVIEKAINQMAATCDDYPYTQFTFPAYPCGGNISGKYIDTTILFEQKEYTNENSTTYIVSGLSCLEILRRVCQYMGWTCREVGQKLYITDPAQLITDSYTRRPIYYADKLLTQWEKDQTSPDVEAEDMDDEFVYHGDGHEMGMAQGAKSVEVVAKVERQSGFGLPGFPFGDSSTEEWVSLFESDASNPAFVHVYNVLNKNLTAYSNIAYTFHKSSLQRTGDTTVTATYLGTSTRDEVLPKTALRAYSLVNETRYSGAFFARYSIGNDNTEYEEGLYVTLMPMNGAFTGIDPAFRMWTLKPSSFYDGNILIDANMLFIGLDRYNSQNQPLITGNLGDAYMNMDSEEIWFHLKIGDKYWNGSAFSTTYAKFKIKVSDGGFQYKIPVDAYMSGEVEIAIYSVVTVTNINTLNEVIFKMLNVSFRSNTHATTSDRGENKYYRLLGTNFSDEVSVNVDLASSLNNAPSPSLIMEDTATPMTEINYGTSQSPDMRRPEVELLNRLSTYYGLPRRTVTIDAQHPTTAPLPLLRLTGYDSKNYLPLAESRDWQADKSTLTCMENPFPAS